MRRQGKMNQCGLNVLKLYGFCVSNTVKESCSAVMVWPLEDKH